LKSDAGAPTGPAAAPGSFTPPTPAELAPLFPQLEILELLGQGGMGAVYKARQPALDRLVALKILPTQAERDPTFAERFIREAKALAKLNHPHIVAVYDFGQAGSMFYFLMEYVDGLNLRQLLRQGQLKPAEALKIVPQICEALQFAHDEGIVHRDIKPENILLDKKGRVKIADFGLAKLLARAPGDPTLTGTQQVMGTMGYMAPEQIDRPQEVDHRADIYSLGVVFYEMLTGELPRGRFASPSEKVQIDVRLDEVVLRALAREPERRYQHASEVKTDLSHISEGNPGGARGGSTLVLPLPPMGWRLVLVAVGMACSVLLIVLGLIMLAFGTWGPGGKAGIVLGTALSFLVGGCGGMFACWGALRPVKGTGDLVMAYGMLGLAGFLLGLIATGRESGPNAHVLSLALGFLFGGPGGLFGSWTLMNRGEGGRAREDQADWNWFDCLMLGVGCLAPLATWMVFRSTLHSPDWRHHEVPAVFLGAFDVYMVLFYLVFRLMQRARFLKALQTRRPGAPAAPASPATGNSPRPDRPETESDLRQIRDQVHLPAVGLLVTGLVGVFGVLFTAHPYIAWFADETVGYVTALVLSGSFLVAGSRMRNLRLYDFCLIASLLALVPVTFGYPLGLFAGLWALWVLRKPEVMAAFDRRPESGS
jgi:predicted Ser/Thr protein kinase